jgi:hypothetical protein
MSFFEFGTFLDSSFSASGRIHLLKGLAYLGDAPNLSSLTANAIDQLSIRGDASYTNFDISGTVGSFSAGTLNNSLIDFTSLRSSTFIGGNAADSQFNFTGGAGTSLSFSLNNVTDSFITDTGYLHTLRLNSMLDSSADSGGITANTIGSFQVRLDYKADFKLTPTLGYKYSMASGSVGGTASGNWDMGGTMNSFSGHAFDTSFDGTFGRFNTFGVGGTFSGSLTGGSIGNASMGNMTNGYLWLTDPYSANSWNLGSLHVANEISSSQIISDGNLGSIGTMFTFNSQIEAGISSGYTFGQIPLMSDFSSPSIIKSYVSDCPNKTTFHFDDSYIGAYDLQNIHIGNIQTMNGGIPTGFAANAIDKLQAAIKNKTISLKNIHSASDVSAALNAAGITPSDLGDLQFLLPAQ